MTKKRGAQPGNQNAKKETTSEMFACRATDETKGKIKVGAKKRGISQGAYIALLVEADYEEKNNDTEI